eukprot:COSAG02_NODE_4190_length_5645_cov_5.686801_3_plen_33_part_00
MEIQIEATKGDKIGLGHDMIYGRGVQEKESES